MSRRGAGKISTAIVIASMIIGASWMTVSGVDAFPLWVFWGMTIFCIFCGSYGDKEN